jgi:hypothetical protein
MLRLRFQADGAKTPQASVAMSAASRSATLAPVGWLPEATGF